MGIIQKKCRTTGKKALAYRGKGGQNTGTSFPALRLGVVLYLLRFVSFPLRLSSLLRSFLVVFFFCVSFFLGHPLLSPFVFFSFFCFFFLLSFKLLRSRRRKRHNERKTRKDDNINNKKRTNKRTIKGPKKEN